jgi:hypothetical protein
MTKLTFIARLHSWVCRGRAPLPRGTEHAASLRLMPGIVFDSSTCRPSESAVRSRLSFRLQLQQHLLRTDTENRSLCSDIRDYNRETGNR